GLAAISHRHGVAAHAQEVCDALGMVTVIIDNEDAGCHAASPWAGGSGSWMTTRVPRPGSLVISTVPRCCSPICLTVASPSPGPKSLVLNRGSKTLGSISLGMPQPVSTIEIWTRPP